MWYSSWLKDLWVFSPLTFYSQDSAFPFSGVAPAPMNERQPRPKERGYAQQPVLGTIESIVCSQHCGAKSHFIAQCVLGIPLHQYNRPALKLSCFPHLPLSQAAPHSPAAGIIIHCSPRLRSPPFARATRHQLPH